MPVFSAVGYMMKGGKSSRLTETGLDRDSFKGEREGVSLSISNMEYNYNTLKISFTLNAVPNITDTRMRMYFIYNTKEHPHHYTSYYDSEKEFDFSKTGSFSQIFSKKQINSLKDFDPKNFNAFKMYVAFRNSKYYTQDVGARIVGG